MVRANPCTAPRRSAVVLCGGRESEGWAETRCDGCDDAQEGELGEESAALLAEMRALRARMDRRDSERLLGDSSPRCDAKESHHLETALRRLRVALDSALEAEFEQARL